MKTDRVKSTDSAGYLAFVAILVAGCLFSGCAHSVSATLAQESAVITPTLPRATLDGDTFSIEISGYSGDQNELKGEAAAGIEALLGNEGLVGSNNSNRA